MRHACARHRQVSLILTLFLIATTVAGCIRSFTLPSGPRATLEVSGIVTSSDGLPIAGATVEVNQRSTVTGPDGTFVLRDVLVPDGRAWYKVTAPQYASRTGSIAATRSAQVRLDVALTAAHTAGSGTVAGRVNFAAPPMDLISCPAWPGDGIYIELPAIPPSLPPASHFPPPNDECYPAQYHLTQIQAQWAWTQTMGSPSIVVAVMSSGVMPDHPDLQANLVPGWNTYHGNDDTTDIIGFGTMAAGLIGAVGNNGIGVIGIAPNVRIMPIRAANLISGTQESVANGIRYAVDHGADIIQTGFASWEDDPDIRDAVTYAQENGVIVVAAAGNLGYYDDSVQYPARYDGVIAVGATDPNMDRTAISDFSGRGEGMNLVAPGTDLWSTSISDRVPYGMINGTEGAAAIVSGVVALMLSNGIHPSEVEEILYRTAVRIGDPESNLDDLHTYGYGLVNAYAAVLGLDPADTVLFVVNATDEIVGGITSPDQARQFTVTDVPESDGLTLVGWIDVNHNGYIDMGDYYGLQPISLEDSAEITVELLLDVYNQEQPIVYDLLG